MQSCDDDAVMCFVTFTGTLLCLFITESFAFVFTKAKLQLALIPWNGSGEAKLVLIKVFAIFRRRFSCVLFEELREIDIVVIPELIGYFIRRQ